MTIPPSFPPSFATHFNLQDTSIDGVYSGILRYLMTLQYLREHINNWFTKSSGSRTNVVSGFRQVSLSSGRVFD